MLAIAFFFGGCGTGILFIYGLWNHQLAKYIPILDDPFLSLWIMLIIGGGVTNFCRSENILFAAKLYLYFALGLAAAIITHEVLWQNYRHLGIEWGMLNFSILVNIAAGFVGVFLFSWGARAIRHFSSRGVERKQSRL